VGRRDRRRGSQGRAEDRVRGRVRQRVQQRPQGRQTRGSESRRGPAFDVDEIEGYARRLKDEVEDNPGLTGAASGLAGAAASGLAGSGLAHRLTGGGASEGDPGDEIRERLELMEERLQRLEDEVRALREGGESAPEAPTEPGPAPDPEGNQ
jgi:hypothetical protein